MAGGLRFRAEAAPVVPPAQATYTPATKVFTVGTTILIPNSALVGIQRAGVYRLALFNTVATASTFQFQDTAGNVLSALYQLGLSVGAAFIIGDGAVNGDPLWQSLNPGVGIQLVVTGTIAGDIWTALGA